MRYAATLKYSSSIFKIARSTRWRLGTITSISCRNASSSGPSSPPDIRLRDYQEECIQSVLSYIERGHKRLGVSLATGSGKTVIFSRLIERVKSRNEEATQTLIIAHRRELIEQAARHCSNAYLNKKIDIEMGALHSNGTADITVASVQSLMSGDRLLKFDRDRYKLVLVDEAHHIVATNYMTVLAHFGLTNELKINPGPVLVGVSATMSRFDGLRLSDAIDHIVYHKDYLDMIEDKWLSSVIFTTVESKVNLSKVKSNSFGDFMTGQLSKAVNTPETNDITVKSWLSRAAQRKSTLVFCVDRTHVHDLTKAFRAHGIDARYILGDTPKKTRGVELDKFRNRAFPVLLNCGVFTEGTDIPGIDCVLLARPTRSRGLLTQMIGRGMRLHDGKSNCHIIDMVASLEKGIVTTPTLYGLDPNARLQEATPEQLKSLKEGVDAKPPTTPPPKSTITESEGPRSVSFTDYGSVFDLIDDTSGDRHVRGISQLAWIQATPDRYILTFHNNSFLSVTRDDQLTPPFQVNFTEKMWASEFTKSPFKRPRKIADADTLSDAVHAADTFASEHSQWSLMYQFAPWRRQPASDGQLQFLSKVQKTALQDMQKKGITKGKAADMITKIKFGARGQFADIAAERRKGKKILEQQAREEERRELEKVKVGPLLA